MPAIEKDRAVEKLAEVVERLKPTALAAVYDELFPEKPVPDVVSSTVLAEHVRHHLAAEEVGDLWRVVFPQARNVWYNEEDGKVHYNEESIGYAEIE